MNSYGIKLLLHSDFKISQLSQNDRVDVLLSMSWLKF